MNNENNDKKEEKNVEQNKEQAGPAEPVKNPKGKKLTYKINDNVEVFAYEQKISDLYRSGPYLYTKEEYSKFFNNLEYQK